MPGTDRKYWVFSNRAVGSYHDNFWDMSTILRTGRYSLGRTERNCSKVVAGDVGYLRVYGSGYVGRFEVASVWQMDDGATKEAGPDGGFFRMADTVLWPRPVPQSLITRDLSNRNVRARLIGITERDTTIIDTAQSLYQRLGLGFGDGDIVLLERGIEEAVKPNLGKMGLRLAQQQLPIPGVGRIDLICTNANGDFVVIELKRGQSSREVIGQLLTYVGYVKENLAAPGQQVQGWIITGDYDERLRLAASAAGITLRVVRLP